MNEDTSVYFFLHLDLPENGTTFVSISNLL